MQPKPSALLSPAAAADRAQGPQAENGPLARAESAIQSHIHFGYLRPYPAQSWALSRLLISPPVAVAGPYSSATRARTITRAQEWDYFLSSA
jgi:hypothetical protein